MYEDLASVYDRLSEIDHKQWAAFIHKILQHAGIHGGKILDLACGTGILTGELVQLGYNLTGLDLSEQMLSMAESKLRTYGVPLFRGDMRQLPSLGTFDTVICTSDSLNYLANQAELLQAFAGVAKLEPQLFVFDLNTPYYLAEVLGDNSFQHVEEEIAYIWDNSYCRETKSCIMDITFFWQQQGDNYRRFDENHVEKVFELSEVEDLLRQTGWYLWQVFDGYAPQVAKEESWRWVFVAGRRPALDTFQPHLLK